jgi:hypothetical protein
LEPQQNKHNETQRALLLLQYGIEELPAALLAAEKKAVGWAEEVSRVKETATKEAVEDALDFSMPPRRRSGNFLPVRQELIAFRDSQMQSANARTEAADAALKTVRDFFSASENGTIDKTLILNWTTTAPVLVLSF